MRPKKHYKELDDDTLFLGDIHGRLSFINNIRSSTRPTQERDVVQVGDLNLFNLSKFLPDLQEVLEKEELTMHVLRGNHDNPYFWTPAGIKDLVKYDRIKIIRDYTELVIGGTSYLCVGGGISVDRQVRTPHIDYWPEEKVVDKRVDNKYEGLICHSAPSFFNKTTPTDDWSYYRRDPALRFELELERDVIDVLVKEIECHTIIGGHYHNNAREYRYFDGKEMKYRCLDIDEVCNYYNLFE